MFKNIAFRIIRSRVKGTLPLLNKQVYNRMFTLTYKFFLYLKPSAILTIVLALLKGTSLKNLISIPSIFILFNSIFSDSAGVINTEKALLTKLESQNLIHEDNNLDAFFLIVIVLAFIKRGLKVIFKLL